MILGDPLRDQSMMGLRTQTNLIKQREQNQMRDRRSQGVYVLKDTKQYIHKFATWVVTPVMKSKSGSLSRKLEAGLRQSAVLEAI